VRLSIDDFDTGSGGLDLQRLPLDEVKLPGSMLLAVGRDPDAETALRERVARARRLGLTVIAEGVERPELLELVTRLGCDGMQGALISRPRREKDVRAWLLTGRRAPEVAAASGGNAGCRAI
jgi:EAL domain-containing protein (putative c-di-GMP-specific phosphodiesterase class I)